MTRGRVVFEDGVVGSVELAEASGASYRQLDYWTRAGVFNCVNPHPGQGTARRYPASELQLAQLIGTLRRCGFTVVVAGQIARVLHEIGTVQLGEGLQLTYRGDV